MEQKLYEVILLEDGIWSYDCALCEKSFLEDQEIKDHIKECHKGRYDMELTNEQKLNILLQNIDDGNSDYEEVITNLFTLNVKLLEACKYVVKYHREHDSGEGELFGLDFVTTCISAIRESEVK